MRIVSLGSLRKKTIFSTYRRMFEQIGKVYQFDTFWFKFDEIATFGGLENRSSAYFHVAWTGWSWKKKSNEKIIANCAEYLTWKCAGVPHSSRLVSWFWRLWLLRILLWPPNQYYSNYVKWVVQCLHISNGSNSFDIDCFYYQSVVQFGNLYDRMKIIKVLFLPYLVLEFSTILQIFLSSSRSMVRHEVNRLDVIWPLQN